MTTITKDHEGCDFHAPTPAPAGAHAVGPLPLDLKKYQSQVEDFDLTEEQRIELLQTLWGIMTVFVDLGFGVDAVQLLRKSAAPDSLNCAADAIIKERPALAFNPLARDAGTKEDPS